YQASTLGYQLSIRVYLIDSYLVQVRDEQHIGITTRGNHTVIVIDAPVLRVVQGCHLVGLDRWHSELDRAPHFIVEAAAIEQVGYSAIVDRQSDASPVRQRKIDEEFDDLPRAFGFELKHDNLSEHRQCLIQARRMAR